MTEDLLAKAKEAQSPEELLTLVQENGMDDFTQEEAESLYAQLHTTGELTDEELENVTGGKVTVGGQKYKVVASRTNCFTGKFRDDFEIKFTEEGGRYGTTSRQDHKTLRTIWAGSSSGDNQCGMCVHLGFTKALTGYCEVEHGS